MVAAWRKRVMNANVVEVLFVALHEEHSKAVVQSRYEFDDVLLNFRSAVSLSSICPIVLRTDVPEVWLVSAGSIEQIIELYTYLARNPLLHIVVALDAEISPEIVDSLESHQRLSFTIQSSMAIKSNFRDVLFKLRRHFEQCWESDTKRVVHQVLRHVSARKVNERTWNWLLARFGRVLQVDRSYYCEFSPLRNTMNIAYEWCAPGVPSEKHRLKDAPSSRYRWFAEEICCGSTVVMNSLNDLPSSALSERVELMHEQVQSLICAPIMQGRKAVGFVGISSTRSERSWQKREVDFVKTIAAVLAAVKSGEEIIHERAREKQLFVSALDSLSDGVAIVDSSDVPVFCNAIMREQVSLVGEVVRSNPATSDLLNQNSAGIIADNGARFQFFERSINDPSDDKGDYNILICRDITKEFELAKRLERSQKLEAVGRLASGVSHDFNNLLTAILGYVGLLLQRTTDDHEFHSELMQIHRSSIHASQLIRQLLSFASNRKDTTCCEPDLVINETSESFFSLVGEHIRIDTELDATNVRLELGAVQFQQIVLNLVLNARDAMPHGGTIKIESSIEADSERGFVLRVRDTGVGISKEDQEKLFEPFYTTKDEGQGTGLGLATVAEIVASIDGKISVESELGEGTCFCIWLPRSISTQQIDERLVSSPQFGLVRGDETILVVEDEDAVRQLIREVLELAGYRVIVANHGRHALRIIEEFPAKIDVIVADMVMPYLGGLELVQRVRKLRPNIKVLFVSGYHSAWSQTKLRQGSNSFEFMSKPFLPVDFTNKIRKLLDEDTALEVDAVLRDRKYSWSSIKNRFNRGNSGD